ncbi:Modification methylase DpnIIB [uncultured Butyricicoccus sp.]|uniref:Site-specific DNA-methyltransferase n=1 Tax=Agathobaculum ammoniilyticum TaxID=2981778 RepID=A0ABT2U2Y1_9FIRM|nr:site-specific DNA-methyltransferase [Agathobaculum ammoniilyticum]MCU6788586.1 site-specific DNA-methyltransferase [Agathobaculum ammoniilyticum]SCI82190.1 Modification methylase DpnIIB [uncultured Butyricicoccus sp.]
METTTKLELLDPAALIPSAANPRVHSQRQIRELRASLREYGVVSPVLVDQERNIIAGHAVVEAALAECVPAVPCVYVEHLTPTQRKAYMIASNRLAEKSHWDDGLLDACLQELFDAGFDLQLTGFGEYRLSDALARDAAPDLPDGGQEIDQCRRGDLWELGSHRLLCGDATRPEDMRRLMRDERAWLLLTDPPYNVDYHSKKTERAGIENDAMSSSRFSAFLTDALTAARSAMQPGAAFYIWYASNCTDEFHAACKAAKLDVHDHLIWVKNQFVLGRGDYNSQYEPCLYGWDGRASHRWFGGDGQCTVYFCDRPQASAEHPTMKPVELFARQIRNSTKKGELVLDPFCGSGTAVLAAETYGRRCRAMELSPHNCDVIIRRWEEMTGRKAVLLEGGAADGGTETAD